jgi:tetrahydromethanopterin S-methyltransferase subunit B
MTLELIRECFKMSKSIHPSVKENLEKVEKAIQNIQRSKDKKLSYNRIAKRAGISRTTIYNNSIIYEYCTQAIKAHEEVIGAYREASVTTDEKPSTSRYKILEKRYRKVKQKLKEEQEKNEKVLYQNNELTHKIFDLKERIDELERHIQRMKDQKVIKVN